MYSWSVEDITEENRSSVTCSLVQSHMKSSCVLWGSWTREKTTITILHCTPAIHFTPQAFAGTSASQYTNCPLKPRGNSQQMKRLLAAAGQEKSHSDLLHTNMNPEMRYEISAMTFVKSKQQVMIIVCKVLWAGHEMEAGLFDDTEMILRGNGTSIWTSPLSHAALVKTFIL